MQWILPVVALVSVALVIRERLAGRRKLSELTRIVDLSPAAMVIFDESAVLYANNRAVGALGEDDQARVIGRPLEAVLDTDTVQLARDAYGQVVSHGEPLTMRDVTLTARSGVSALCDLTVVPATFRGRPAAQCSFDPVDEKHAAQLALQETEERFRMFFEEMPVPMYRTLVDGTIAHANNALAAMLGFDSAADIEGINATDFYSDPDDRADLASQMLASGLVSNHTSSLIAADGRTIWVRDSSHTIEDDGELVFEGVLVDVTREHRFNTELEKRAEQQQALAEIARLALRETHVGTVMDAAASKVCEVLNAECLVISRLKQDHGRVTTSATYRVDSVRDREMLLDYAQNQMGEIPSIDDPIPLEPAEAEGGILVRGTQVALSSGSEPYGAIAVAGRGFDPSQQDLDFLAATAATLGSAISRSHARARMDRLMRSKDEFIASVSHELRTPLTVVAGLALELEHGLPKFSPEELSEFISLIADQSREMTNLIEDLLVAARADMGKVAIYPQRTDLRESIDHVIASCSLADRARIQVGGSRVEGFVDPTRLRQVLRNLVTNAIRYGGSRIHVAAREQDGEALLTVFDDGPGIAEGDRDRVFTAYERARSSNGSVPGSVGLGLTVSRQLTELMGGSISYRYDGGSFFEVRLPMAGPALQPAELVRDGLEQILE